MTEVFDNFSPVLERRMKTMITKYGFSEEAKIRPLSQSENQVYLIDDDRQLKRYVIRVNSGRLSYHTPQSIASELHWMKAIRNDTDIVVPEVLTALDGQIVQTIEYENDGSTRLAAIYSFLTGEEPSESNLEPEFERLGEITARMHKHVQSWVSPDGFRRHSWTPEVVLDDHLNWGSWKNGKNVEGETLGLLETLDAILRKRLQAVPVDSGHFGLIHADLRLANLLVDGNRTGIIDFDDCGFGWYLYDLASALSFIEERDDVPELIEHWLLGYRRIAQVPRALEQEIETLIMLRRMQLLGWVGFQQHKIDFARDIADQFTVDTCALAEKYLTTFG